MVHHIVTLHSKIKTNDQVTLYTIIFHLADDSCELDWPTCYQIIKGTCEGLNHLHDDQKNPILHLDMNPSNIFLDTNMTPKITGFYQSRTFSTPPEVSYDETDTIVGIQ